MVSFDRFSTNSCQPVIVSMSLSCTMFEIFDVEEYHDLEIEMRGHSPCEFMHGLWVYLFIHLYTAGPGSKLVSK